MDLTIQAIRLMWRRRLAIHNSGKGANIHEHACQSNLSMLKVLPVRKKPCRQKPFLKRKKRPQKETILSENQDRNLLSYFEQL